jgi:small subunit ribosomal protein S17
MEEATNQKTRTGTVTSNKMQKTVVVAVERLVSHPKYKKFIRRRNTFKAHDEEGTCQVGDVVLIQECRPLSKTKRWKVIRVLEKAATV